MNEKNEPKAALTPINVVQSLRDLWHVSPVSTPLHELAKHVLVLGDRVQAANALLVAAACDEQLAARLRDVMKVQDKELYVKLFGTQGPLHAFAAKTDMAYALGLIEPHHYKILRVIAKVRNAFAHSSETLRFRDEQIVKLLQKAHPNGGPIKGDPEDFYIALAADVESHHLKAMPNLPTRVAPEVKLEKRAKPSEGR